MRNGSRAWAMISLTSLNARCAASWPSRNAGAKSGTTIASSTSTAFPTPLV